MPIRVNVSRFLFGLHDNLSACPFALQIAYVRDAVK